MTREELKLNDFEGFNRYLKSLEAEKKIGWRMFYDEETDIFTPPIVFPKTLPEYQLDHYAMWMVMYAHRLREKPKFCNELCQPHMSCYACEWRNRHIPIGGELLGCSKLCPLILDIYYGCGFAYQRWLYKSEIPKYAHDIAHLLWREN